MKMKDIVSENTSSAMAAVVMPMGDNKMQKRNPDGTAKNASGEKAKMYHWCANMKGGKK